MLSKAVLSTSLLSALAAAAPKPQVPGYTDADASFSVEYPTGTPASVFGPDSQVPAVPTQTGSAYPRISPNPTGATSHGPYSGTPTTTGAAKAPATLGTAIAPLPPNPTATYYNTNGSPQNPMPIPYTPAGGLGTNGSEPRYMVESDFDYESIQLGLYQEWIELDLFNYGVSRFSEEEFAEAGLNAEDISLIQFMANQEVGHAALLSNIIAAGGRTPAEQCEYKYDFDTVRDFVNFCQRLTRWGESGVYGFLSHLDARDAATLLTQSIATEARQQMTFRQFSGAHPFPVYFETGISQSMAWSLLSRYIVGCPANNSRIEWPIFPFLSVTNEPNLLQDGYNAAITHNRTSLTEAGRQVEFSWESAGQSVGPNSSYNTSIGGLINATEPAFVAFINQLNVTYAPLTVTGNNTGYAIQPNGTVFPETPNNGIINGTSFVALTDVDLFVTPFNLSLLNDHIFAWGLYQAN